MSEREPDLDADAHDIQHGEDNDNPSKLARRPILSTKEVFCQESIERDRAVD